MLEEEALAGAGRSRTINHPFKSLFPFLFRPLVVVIKIKLLCNKIKVEMKKCLLPFFMFYLFLLANISVKEASESLTGFFLGLPLCLAGVAAGADA